jgi:hypothetical protein
MGYTSITYKQTLVNFRTTFEDATDDDNYDISYNINISCDVEMDPIDITEAQLKEGFETGNCATESPSASSYTGEKFMISSIREKLNQDLTTTTNPANKSVKQKLLEFINDEDDVDVASDKNRIKWINISYGNVVLGTFAEGLTGTDLAITTHDIIDGDYVDFIFRFSGGPRSVDSASPSFYTVKIQFKVTAATAPSSADTVLE